MEHTTHHTRPLMAARLFCFWCSNFQIAEIQQCPCDGRISRLCPLYHLRMGKKIKGTSTISKLMEKCRDCGEGSLMNVRNCEFPECPIYPYRIGKNPARQGIGARNYEKAL